jgi:succinate dehydrogenase / fumarate reductase flavoprotein subunit
MQTGLDQVQALKAEYGRIQLSDRTLAWNTELIEAIELQHLMVVGEVILTSALHRQESRGAHSREDFPNRDDQTFLNHTLAYHSAAGVDLAYMPVVINRFEPKERKY